jgi:predicted outer membrane repeat protein
LNFKNRFTLTTEVAMRAFKLLLPVVLVAVRVVSLNATTIHVPADSATIQAGINGAVDGDTVLVADGTYTGDGNRDIDFGGKAIVVTSEGGPKVTIVDGAGGGRAFDFSSGETSSSVVDGFTIHDFHSAIWCNGSSPTISNNTFTENSANIGGAISCYNYSSPTISNNTFTANSVDYFGGAIDCRYSSPTISNNTFTENSANHRGGAIYCSNSSSPIISNNTFTDNSAAYNGGAIYCRDYSNPTISNNTFTANFAGYDGTGGGAIYCYFQCSPTISNNTFTANFAVGGGAIYNNDCSPTISNNAFISNSARGWWGVGGHGGAISCFGFGSTISNNTFTANIAMEGNGGAISCNYDPIIKNCILWGDAPDEIYDLGSTATVTYSDVQGGWPGEGNIDADPMFVQPDTLSYTDCRLLWGSPCIDTGVPILFDPDGTRSDMGAQPTQQSTAGAGRNHSGHCRWPHYPGVLQVLSWGRTDIPYQQTTPHRFT